MGTVKIREMEIRTYRVRPNYRTVFFDVFKFTEKKKKNDKKKQTCSKIFNLYRHAFTNAQQKTSAREAFYDSYPIFFSEFLYESIYCGYSILPLVEQQHHMLL